MNKKLFCALLVSTLVLPVAAKNIGAYGDSTNTITIQPTDTVDDKQVKKQVSPQHAKAYDGLSPEQKQSVQVQGSTANKQKKIEQHTQKNQKMTQDQIKSFHQSQMQDLKKAGKNHLKNNGNGSMSSNGKTRRSPCDQRRSY